MSELRTVGEWLRSLISDITGSKDISEGELGEAIHFIYTNHKNWENYKKRIIR